MFSPRQLLIIALLAITINYCVSAKISPLLSRTSCTPPSAKKLGLFRWFNINRKLTKRSTYSDSSSIRFMYHTKTGIEYITNVNASRAINTDRPSKIIVHGWNTDPFTPIITTLVGAYLIQPQHYNVITVDWSGIASRDYLEGCLKGLATVGEVLAAFVMEIERRAPNFVQNTDVIGHSCGAHVAGYAGNKVAAQTGRKLARIVALDASKAVFAAKSASRALRRQDASYVTAFFTNPGFKGMDKPYADSNVLFNGECQPQCLGSDTQENALCSHVASVFYWADSVVNPSNYLAATCSRIGFLNCDFNELEQVGDHIAPGTEGNFFLTFVLKNNN